MDLLNVQALFQKGIFSIPDYQRGYSWEGEQIKDFLDDLEEVKEYNLKAHYTGAIIVVLKKAPKQIAHKLFDVFEVVDGQQRLTTFSIFLTCCSSRLQYLRGDKADIEEIRSSIVYKNNPTIELNNQTNDFYREHILIGGVQQIPSSFINKAQQNLADAKKQISRHLERYQKTEDLLSLVETLKYKFKVNFDILSNENEVGIVFETMNNRGLPLTQMDKVKNYLIYVANYLDPDNQNNLAAYINQCFGRVFEELMKMQATTISQENDFLRYSYTVFRGGNHTDVHTEIKKTLFPKRGQETTAKNLKDYVDFLVKAATIYSKLKRAELVVPQIKTLVQKIIWLGNPSNFVPLLIALFLQYPEIGLLGVLEQMEKFSFVVYKIGNRKNKAAQNDLQKLAAQIYSKEKLLRDVVNMLGSNKYASSFEFKSSLLVDNFYLAYENSPIYYLLFEYEQYLHKTEKTEFSPYTFEEFLRDINGNNPKIQIEHILPQNPYWEEPSKHLHKLGNLTLTFDNSKLSNKEFHNKQTIYKNSNLLCERKLVQFSKWDGTVINSRTKELMEFALTRWKLQQD